MQQARGCTRGAMAFELYLRTGHRRGFGAVERKFNPWHDPDDGRFTFAGQGDYFSGGESGARRPYVAARGAFASPGNVASSPVSGAGPTQDRFHQYDPHNPRNHGTYVVKKGDSLVRIAAMRKGLSVKDLEWFNGISATRPLRIGQRIKLPHQEFLDSGKRAYDKFLALNYYSRTHGGQLPPDPSNPPSLERQVLDSNWRKESKNGYDVLIDVLARPRKLYGLSSFTNIPKRSRRLQKQAGGSDRRSTDDGGHYIAARFNGPLEAFNHFAQNINLNRGAYRMVEDQWAKDVKDGKSVFLDITPHYPGKSQRPDYVDVIWYVDGTRHFRKFFNEASGQKNVKR